MTTRTYKESTSDATDILVRGNGSEVPMQYGLYRIEDDATTTLVSEHDDLLTGIAAGKYAVEVEDYDFAYALHTDGVRVATFAGGRIGYLYSYHQ